MHLQVVAERHLDAPPAAAFALTLDAQRFPSLFAGFGPIPALRAIRPHAPAAVGATREVESSDGSRLTERITALVTGECHDYTLSGLRPPLAWLAREGHAQWRFNAHRGGCDVRWSYRFALSTPLVLPLAWPLLQVAMRIAMQRCLAAMQQALAERGTAA